jgi:hypothetical protein
VDFLLECVGFPPHQDPEELATLVRRTGEPVAWRGPAGEHLRLDLAAGVELRLDCEGEGQPLTLLPYFRSPHRLRIAVDRLRRVEDSPFDALLTGWVAPPAPEGVEPQDGPGAYLLSTWLTDGRRLPGVLEPGKVLAISVAGFAVDVSYVGPNSGVSDPEILERPQGARFSPLGGAHAPGGCTEISARVKSVRHARNPITQRPIEVLELDAPERPLEVFVSPWQLQQDGHQMPRPGWRVEGSFFFTGRITGGLPSPIVGAGKVFG